MISIPDIVIAVDGFSSTGKSSFAKLVAKEFDLIYLDSGALYRAVTLFAQENGLIDKDNVINVPALEEALKTLDVHFESIEGVSNTFIADRNVEKEIRGMAVSSQVSPIATVPVVRNFVDNILHICAAKKRVIMDGRDIGSAVFPNAEVKIFMTATNEVRAQRRFDEMKAKGDNPVMEDVLKNLLERDYIDSHREMNPLTQAEDAFVMDNTNMTLKEEVCWMEGLLRGRFCIL